MGKYDNSGKNKIDINQRIKSIRIELQQYFHRVQESTDSVDNDTFEIEIKEILRKSFENLPQKYENALYTRLTIAFHPDIISGTFDAESLALLNKCDYLGKFQIILEEIQPRGFWEEISETPMIWSFKFASTSQKIKDFSLQKKKISAGNDAQDKDAQIKRINRLIQVSETRMSRLLPFSSLRSFLLAGQDRYVQPFRAIVKAISFLSKIMDVATRIPVLLGSLLVYISLVIKDRLRNFFNWITRGDFARRMESEIKHIINKEKENLGFSQLSDDEFFQRCLENSKTIEQVSSSTEVNLYKRAIEANIEYFHVGIISRFTLLLSSLFSFIPHAKDETPEGWQAFWIVMAWPLRLLVGIPVLLLRYTVSLIEKIALALTITSVFAIYASRATIELALYFPFLVIDSPSSILLAAAAVGLAFATFGISPILLPVAGLVAGLSAIVVGTIEDMFPSLKHPYIKWPLITLVLGAAAVATALTLIWGAPALAFIIPLLPAVIPSTLLMQGLFVAGIALLVTTVPIIPTLIISGFKALISDELDSSVEREPLQSEDLTKTISMNRERYVVKDNEGSYLKLFKNYRDALYYTQQQGKKELCIVSVIAEKGRSASGHTMSYTNIQNQRVSFFKAAKNSGADADLLSSSPESQATTRPGEYTYSSQPQGGV